MARVLCLGLVAADFVMTLDELPRRVEKYRARAARIDVGGAARMAAAVAALGGGRRARRRGGAGGPHRRR